ncbi:MAG TPA: hypothetical protein VG318_06180 [Actinomycetota bacterium]|nr:hypothetical protein [Actinomycetota bacterium]
MIRVSLQEESDKKAIVLVAESVEDVKRLRDLLLQIAQTGQRVELEALEGFELDRDRSLAVERNEAIGFLDTSVSLAGRKDALSRFRWARSGDAWRNAARLLETMISSGGPSHQYLTDNLGDAAEVRVSLGEESP